MQFLIRKFKKYFWKEQWSIAIFRGKIADFVEGNIKEKDLNWLFSDYKDGFRADPFLIEKGTETFLFFEEFEYAKQKGRIMVSKIIEDERGKILASKAKVALEKDTHISYPFVFSYNEDVFMLPETSSENEIALYRAIKFPLKWEKEKVLIPNFAGIDATLHFAKNKWWIFCADEKIGGNKNLQIFFADDLFGEWKAHSQNPVKRDIQGSRMAGALFVWKGKLIRPAQNCEGTYGKAIVLNEVTDFSTENFKEKTVSTFTTNKKSEYSEGMHTISASEYFVTIDAKKFLGIRKLLDPWNYRRKEFQAKIKKMFQKKS